MRGATGRSPIRSSRVRRSRSSALPRAIERGARSRPSNDFSARRSRRPARPYTDVHKYGCCRYAQRSLELLERRYGPGRTNAPREFWGHDRTLRLRP
jgi:hypothetical protein